MTTSSTLSLRSSSASSRASSSSPRSCSDTDWLDDFVGVDLAQSRAALIAGDLALCGVCGRERKEAGCAELLRHGKHPFHQLIEPRPRRPHAAAVQVDELARQAITNCTPDVLLDEA